MNFIDKFLEKNENDLDGYTQKCKIYSLLLESSKDDQQKELYRKKLRDTADQSLEIFLKNPYAGFSVSEILEYRRKSVMD